MTSLLFTGGTILLEDRLLPRGEVRVTGDRIESVWESQAPAGDAEVIDLQGGYLVPGYVDLHVHGGAGADFMDGTEDAFRTICRAHARHGSTSLLPTTTVARHEQHLAFFDLCRRLKASGGCEPPEGARILGAHFYGPYFAYEARGAIPVRPCVPRCLKNTSSTWPTRTASPRRPSPRSCREPRPSFGPAEPAASAATPGTRTPPSRRWRPPSAGACAMSITSSAPCPTGPACA